MQPFDCWMGEIINYWRSVDVYIRAHLRDILTVIGCSTIVHQMHTVIIDNQYTISMYSHFHPKASRTFSYYATTMYVMCTINIFGPSHFSVFGQQYTLSNSIHLFLIYIAHLPQYCLSSSCSSTSITYIKQYSISRPCAAALSGDLCLELHGLMRNDGCHLSEFWSCIDHSFYKSYYITDLKFVCKLHLKFKFCFLS